MTQIPLEELTGIPLWKPLLSTYREQQLQAREADPEHHGWVPRIGFLQETRGQELSKLHGQLIALGLLKFDLGGRTSGMSYQVTPLGLRAIAGVAEDDETDVDPDAADENAQAA